VSRSIAVPAKVTAVNRNAYLEDEDDDERLGRTYAPPESSDRKYSYE
jgi:hypothetical protein